MVGLSLEVDEVPAPPRRFGRREDGRLAHASSYGCQSGSSGMNERVVKVGQGGVNVAGARSDRAWGRGSTAGVPRPAPAVSAQVQVPLLVGPAGRAVEFLELSPVVAVPVGDGHAPAGLAVGQLVIAELLRYQLPHLVPGVLASKLDQ